MLAETAMTEVSIDGVTVRGRVWNFLSRQANRVFNLDDLTKSIRGSQYSEVSRYVSELVAAGVVSKKARGSYEVLAADVAVPPQPLALPKCFGFPAGRRGHFPPIHVPASTDGVWRLMLYLDKKSIPITRARLAAVIDAPDASELLTAFLKGLVSGGYVAQISADEYRLVRRQIETPRLTQAGRPLAHAVRAQHMWRAMKMAGYFTARDLAIAATLPEWLISEDQARSYADDLVSAGYLIARDNADTGRLYRLKSKMNTGPAAPRILRARFVWDPNLCRIMGEAIRIDEVRL